MASRERIINQEERAGALRGKGEGLPLAGTEARYVRAARWV